MSGKRIAEWKMREIVTGHCSDDPRVVVEDGRLYVCWPGISGGKILIGHTRQAKSIAEQIYYILGRLEIESGSIWEKTP